MIIIGSWQRISDKRKGNKIKAIVVNKNGESWITDIGTAHALYNELYRYKQGSITYIVFGD